MFAPLIIGKDDGQYEHITMALLDSGNLLQQPAINASLHQTLGVEVDKTNVVARGANQLSINIEGISKGIYLKFPNLRTSFLVRPLVVKNLASPLNLGSKFNFEFMLTPQLVEQDVNTGIKYNQYKIQGKKGKLFSRLVTVSVIKPYLQDDEMFMKILNKWPDEGRIGQHTLAESRKKWGWDPIIKTEGVESIKPKKEKDGIIQNLESQGMTHKGSTHLTPTDIDHKEPKMTMSSNKTEDTSTVTRVMKLARLTSNAQHYTQPEPSEGLELLPDGSLPHKTVPGPKEVLMNTIPLPKFSLSSLEEVRNLGLTQMEHHVGRNLEERGGIPRVKTMAENYMNSLKNIAVDRPPSCQEPDIPGQGTRQRDQLLKLKPDGHGPMTEIRHKMLTTQRNTCNSCSHDLPPQDTEYTEMDEVPFTAYQDTTIRPGYQETMVINAILPTKGLVFMEPERER